MTRPLTGPKVLAIAVGAFGIIIAVNLVMAVEAARTFPGLETGHSYDDSQSFDRDRAAQDALGWDVRAAYGAGVLSIRIMAPDGSPAAVRQMQALVGWATSTRDDVTPDFTWSKGVFSTPLALPDGNWNIRLTATAADGTPFHRRIPLPIRGGQG